MPYVRPARTEYYMGIAMAVRRRANCLGNRVGAILVLNDHIVSTGYNGTPAGMPNCEEGGCQRCARRDRYRSAEGYDVCVCVHAEQNTLLSAARFGIHVEGAVLYSTMRPCFSCAKLLLQARIHQVHYLHDWKHPDDDLWHSYMELQNRFPGGVHKVDLPDPDERWAVSAIREAEKAGS